ncbi:UrcA family protein [Qipengyuania zhejiangensis]|uniref:UrcA family protein n=1 Tax=Qipengyuania zhejiangensis TaxID=3077782 RepID=UPI002D76D8FB|nr:UrcA family protein [Qipengyuania sp. Z2]
MTNLRKTCLPIVVAAGVALIAMPASAQGQEIVVTGKMNVPEGYDPVTSVVSIADLDLSSSAGEAEMEERVAAAVKKLCWSHPKPARWQVKDSEFCSEFAWESARPQMEAALERARAD